MTAEHSTAGLLRELTFIDGVAIVAGTIIGSGIFLVPGNVARQLNSFGAVLSVWILGGVLSLCGAIALGELGAMFPGAGGLYVYLREAYGRLPAFLYGWGLLTLIHSGSIATLAAAFRIYVAQMLRLSPLAVKLSGVLCIFILSALNCLGLKSGKGIQNTFTVAKLGGLGLMIGLLFWFGNPAQLTSGFLPQGSLSSQSVPFGIALIAILWAYEGWHVVSFAASEFRNPQRDLPRSFFWGTSIVAAVYLLANVAYYLVLAPQQIATAEGVAGYALRTVMGPAAGMLLSVLILVSIIGSINGMILTGSRVYYAMAQEGLFFPGFGRLDSRTHVPVFALTVQGLWAACLMLLGTFQELFTYVIFTAWIFYGLAVAGVVVLRVRAPERERPFRVPAYPWLPLLFVAAATGIVFHATMESPLHALWGALLILAGLPIYLLLFSQSDQPTAHVVTLREELESAEGCEGGKGDR